MSSAVLWALLGVTDGDILPSLQAASMSVATLAASAIVNVLYLRVIVAPEFCAVIGHYLIILYLTEALCSLFFPRLSIARECPTARLYLLEVLASFRDQFPYAHLLPALNWRHDHE